MSATSSAMRTRASSRSTELGHRRQDHRHVEPLVDAGVELDVHREGVLHAERVTERAGDEQAAARDREHHVRQVAIGVYGLGELARAVAELVPGHDLFHAYTCNQVSTWLRPFPEGRNLTEVRLQG